MDFYVLGQASAHRRLGLKLAAAPPNTVGQNFAAGLDPFGFASSRYGQQAQQAGLSESDHNKRMVGNVVGGAVGSGLIVPSAISGMISGATGFAGTPGGLGKRLAAGGRDFMWGVKRPIRGVIQGIQTKRFLNQAAKAGGPSKVPPHIQRAMRDASKEVPIASVTDSANYADGARNAARQARKARPKLREMEQLIRRKQITPAMAEELKAPTATSLNTGLAMLGLGGAVGSAGAGIQYQKGRAAERGFQERINSGDE